MKYFKRTYFLSAASISPSKGSHILQSGHSSHDELSFAFRLAPLGFLFWFRLAPLGFSFSFVIELVFKILDENTITQN